MKIQTITFHNGDKYTGELENSKMHGTGTLIYAYGGRYSGEFSNGKFNGIGKLTFPDGATFEGSFVDGKISGYGRIELFNGDMYVGEWKNDFYHGKGKLIKKDKTVQDGVFHKGIFIKNHFLDKLKILVLCSCLIIAGIWIYLEKLEPRISDIRMQLLISAYGIGFIFAIIVLIFNSISIYKKFTPDEESEIIDDILQIIISPFVYFYKFLIFLSILLLAGVAIWLIISGISYFLGAVITIPAWLIIIIYLLNRK